MIERENVVDLSIVRDSIIKNFGWVAEKGGVIINAGSTIGGAVGHDVDIVVMLDQLVPSQIFPDFVRSTESMEKVVINANEVNPTFSFPRVAWQDFMADICGPESLGIHFLWYSCAAQLFATEPRGLALGLLNGEVIVGNRLADNTCPRPDVCKIWQGIDNVLDPLRLVANPSIDTIRVAPTIGHTIERFIIWDVLAEKVRQKRGFDLVTREDIKQEVNNSSDLLKSIMMRTRQVRDLPATVNKNDILSLGKDIIENWSEIRGLK